MAYVPPPTPTFEKDRIRALKNERITSQKKTFTKWVNSFLDKVSWHKLHHVKLTCTNITFLSTNLHRVRFCKLVGFLVCSELCYSRNNFYRLMFINFRLLVPSSVKIKMSGQIFFTTYVCHKILPAVQYLVPVTCFIKPDWLFCIM